MDYVGIAAAMLAEVGLSFDDVVDLGRPWVIGPPGFEMVVGDPHYRGSCSYPNPDNPMSRQRCLISLSGPVDSDEMLFILAHECGHVLQKPSSTPLYISEYQAEMYAIAAFERHCGRPPSEKRIKEAKKYVWHHCMLRFHQLGENPTKGWDRTVTSWCEFNFA